MKNMQKQTYVTRSALLRLLSDEEVARVSAAEDEMQLVDGDEYVDLEHPTQGVRRATGSSSVPTGRLLPRKAVLSLTWQRIVALLASHQHSRAPASN